MHRDSLDKWNFCRVVFLVHLHGYDWQPKIKLESRCHPVSPLDSHFSANVYDGCFLVSPREKGEMFSSEDASLVTMVDHKDLIIESLQVMPLRVIDMTTDETILAQ